MTTYEILRDIADIWGLLGMSLFFVGVVIWVFRPGASKIYEYQASTPLRHEDRPAPDPDAAAREA